VEYSSTLLGFVPSDLLPTPTQSTTHLPTSMNSHRSVDSPIANMKDNRAAQLMQPEKPENSPTNAFKPGEYCVRRLRRPLSGLQRPHGAEQTAI
jgi:hypothetical protein